MTVVDGITLAIAIIGALLGVVNTWNSVSNTKPKMRVRFLANYSTPDIRLSGYSIEVVNLSSFSLTIQEVGLSMSPFWKRDIERLLLTSNSRMGDQMPCRLEPREQGNFYFQGEISGQSPKKITAAYAKTSCGLYFRGHTPVLQKLSLRLSE